MAFGHRVAMRVLIVGGGVLGTMHAWHALRRGHEVLQIERELDSRGASVRNFGLIWVSGRAEGPEIEVALRGRELWQQLAADVPGIGFRPCGSLTVARTAAELAVAAQAARLPTADEREFELLDVTRTRGRNPALAGELLGALWSGRDAVVEPRAAQRAIRGYLSSWPGYRWLPGREVREADTGGIRDDHGEVHRGDVVLLCTGAWLGGLVRDLIPAVPVRRVRLQMMQTAPAPVTVSTSVADGDSFRYYPAYDAAFLSSTQPQTALAREHGMQLLMVQRRDGALTIGDTHAYDEPFDFDVAEAPYRHLVGVAEAILGWPLPPVTHRWAGVYAQTIDPTQVVFRREVKPGVWLVTGPGGRGMTCSPAIAETSIFGAGL
jgi:FAD dependent oxidoreductase TIGR03364